MIITKIPSPKKRTHYCDVLKKSIPVLLLTLFPFLLASQKMDRTLEILSAPLPTTATPRAQAERLQKILWHIFRNQQYGEFENYPEQLDSLSRCCITGKIADPRFEQSVEADAAFFKAFQSIVELFVFTSPRLPRSPSARRAKET